ncbi:Hsp20/alpha crystallin family protein [Roseivirga sp. BDSF3-8]|uniref:Hsp20/alpha crystallin family protein n=1 Tax=Roseivirga sp. BDSF3-8 TaxID=3241598 RepID=UPI0035326F8C
MALVKFNNDRLFPFGTAFDDFFNMELGNWKNRNFSSTDTTLPAVNIKEDDDGFTVEMAAPGMKKDDFKIDLENNLLTIASEKKEEKKEDKGKYSRKEFSYCSFQRAFTLPDSADNDKIGAKYENGVLFISIPKKEEAKPVPPRQISIA